MTVNFSPNPLVKNDGVDKGDGGNNSGDEAESVQRLTTSAESVLQFEPTTSKFTLAVTSPHTMLSGKVTTIRGTSRRFDSVGESAGTRVPTKQTVSHSSFREFTPAVVIGLMEEDRDEEFGGWAGTLKRNCLFHFLTFTAITSAGCSPVGMTDR